MVPALSTVALRTTAFDNEIRVDHVQHDSLVPFEILETFEEWEFEC